MAREGRRKWGLSSWQCSYKRTTVVICSVNIVIALYVLRSLYASLYVYSNSENAVKYTHDQIRKMEESMRIRRDSKPVELIKLVKELKHEFSGKDSMIELSREVKERITGEVMQILRELRPNANMTEQREAVERWRQEKLEDAKKGSNSTLSLEDAGMLIKALESDWAVLLEDIGLWIPKEIIHHEHDDKPEGVEDPDEAEQILAGRPLPPECHAELHTDYDGAAVKWGLTHHKESAADCCQACLDHAKRAKPGQKKCNIWVYCPQESGCYSPDIYQHKHMECWLKFAEKPRLNFKDKYSESYRSSHPTAPLIVPWVSGVVRA